MSTQAATAPQLPKDDLNRKLTLADPENDSSLIHVGLAGDTYTITVCGEDTAGKFCIIDMLVPPGGGPTPHRHDFEETFILLEGEIETTFRGKTAIVRAGQTVNIPANAPHRFQNVSKQPARMLCICSPAGQDEFFKEVGVRVASRTTPPPKLDEAQQAKFIEKAEELAPRYKTEFLKEA
jgi:mannose-6-phosphate isomerase-like protein (cupin superfamily)